jgi:2-polyprenyl-3-methyl-5-hydroxy-6-metoxy-1,4-benzoquinol methylase
MSALFTAVAETELGGTDGSARKAPTVESCPVCGHLGGRELLHAPDWLHGRSEQYILTRCDACSLVWLNEPPKPEEMHKHYTIAYNELIAGAGENAEDRWTTRKKNLAKYKQSGALLDLGCSSGSFLASMRSDCWKLYGIEMSAESAKIAQSKSGGEIFIGNILGAPFEREMFDVITCFDVLEHLYEPVQVMTKVAEWLRPHGIFFVQVPNINSAEARVFGRYWQGLELPRHLFHYSPDSLRNVAQTAGLVELSIETTRNQTVETSLRYLFDDAFKAIGIIRTPLAYSKRPGLPWRVARKLWRLTVLQLLMVLAPAIGSGEAVLAVFRKGALQARTDQ